MPASQYLTSRDFATAADRAAKLADPSRAAHNPDAFHDFAEAVIVYRDGRPCYAGRDGKVYPTAREALPSWQDGR